jgi:hypothetical protein
MTNKTNTHTPKQRQKLGNIRHLHNNHFIGATLTAMMQYEEKKIYITYINNGQKNILIIQSTKYA